jgi:hypothetical protein
MISKAASFAGHANKQGEDEQPKNYEKATHALMVFERAKT